MSRPLGHTCVAAWETRASPLGTDVCHEARDTCVTRQETRVSRGKRHVCHEARDTCVTRQCHEARDTCVTRQETRVSLDTPHVCPDEALTCLPRRPSRVPVRGIRVRIRRRGRLMPTGLSSPQKKKAHAPRMRTHAPERRPPDGVGRGAFLYLIIYTRAARGGSGPGHGARRGCVPGGGSSPWQCICAGICWGWPRPARCRG